VRSDPAYKSCFEGIRAETAMPVKSTAGNLAGVVDVEAEGDIDAAEIASFANMLTSLRYRERGLRLSNGIVKAWLLRLTAHTREHGYWRINTHESTWW